MLLGLSESLSDFNKLSFVNSGIGRSLSASLVIFSVLDFMPSAELLSLFCKSPNILKKKVLNNYNKYINFFKHQLTH